MSYESGNAQDARVEALWATLDTKKEGHLDLAGLKKGLRKIDHPLKNADNLLADVLRHVDRDSDGKIQYHEFASFVKAAERELWSLFNRIDYNGDGKIDRTELQKAFQRAKLAVPQSKLEHFFAEIDTNNDGTISFEEWRDFLLFIPASAPNLEAVMSYFSSTVKVNPEGDVLISDDTIEGLGYFLAGGISGIVSRTSTAPLDRLKVYLIAHIGNAEDSIRAAKSGAAIQATKGAWATLSNAAKDLWAAGGMRSLFAGNGLNVVKVMPESAVKFGSYEAAKRLAARIEGHSDPKQIHSWSKFICGGTSGMVSQFVVYPLDTLKFRMQCETVKGGLHGNRLIIATAKKMWTKDGFRSFYRGLPMGLAGMFPYAALDLGTFEYLKKTISQHNAKKRGVHEEQAMPGSVATAAIGGFSGAFGASMVYPMNLIRTRLQSQGTVQHPRTYTGIWDVLHQTVKGEGIRGLFKGLTPNLLKVVPAVSITYVVYENSKKMMQLK
ncbi:calcium dependent mitochondrial carrier protein-like protein [Patellaria atrata CBS 101060]|uniref:Mitochondrial thiamine pyrophosphate carrier 1 n=1 Tax=Patellaria atrata CBS 101060 TaxID=1346257 RepID=A0A9P4SGL2_9PEZI|nr:calcium dependent mitochondrial carrier protein-like protein [Patellaria atrata CBS 101060]